MLVKPVSIYPCVVFAFLMVLTFGVYAGIVPGAAGWLAVFCFYLTFLFGLFGAVSGAAWALDILVRMGNMRAALHPEARLAECIARMNDKQLLVLAYALDIEPEGTSGLVDLPNGESIAADTLSRIAENITGDELRPERSYVIDRAEIRSAHDALERSNLITPGTGRTRPRLRDARAFEKVVRQAKGKR